MIVADREAMEGNRTGVRGQVAVGKHIAGCRKPWRERRHDQRDGDNRRACDGNAGGCRDDRDTVRIEAGGSARARDRAGVGIARRDGVRPGTGFHHARRERGLRTREIADGDAVDGGRTGICDGVPETELVAGWPKPADVELAASPSEAVEPP